MLFAFHLASHEALKCEEGCGFYAGFSGLCMFCKVCWCHKSCASCSVIPTSSMQESVVESNKSKYTRQVVEVGWCAGGEGAAGWGARCCAEDADWGDTLSC